MAIVADASIGGGFGAYSSRPTVIEVILPKIPLWVPEHASRILHELIRSTIHLALQDVAGRVSEEASAFSDTGQLAQSFGADPATSTGGIEVLGMASSGEGVIGRVFSSLPYAIVMEHGRRPGSPISRIGIDAIGLWAQRKLGLSVDEAKHAKWAIAAHIIGQGIEGKYYFEDGVALARPRVEQMFQILGDQLTAALLKPGQGQTGTA